MSKTDEIRDFLFANADEVFRSFNSRLIPTVNKSTVIGVKTPVVRAYAKKISGSDLAKEFLSELPHGYLEENNLHSFLLETIKNFDECIALTEEFLPYIDNWATCDCFMPAVFKKNRAAMYDYAVKWMDSNAVYTVRYGIGVAMKLFTGEYFDMTLAEKIAGINTEEYYVHMMVAWYFATALAKNYDSVIGFIKDKRLDKITHDKAIQKALESYRVSDEHKSVLRSLKIR